MSYATLEKKRKYAREYAKMKRDTDPVFREKWYSFLKKYRQSGKEYEKIKNNPERLKVFKAVCKKSHEKNKDKYLQNDIKGTDILDDRYIVRQLYKDGISTKTTRRNPDLIECKRLILKIKRFNYGKD